MNILSSIKAESLAPIVLTVYKRPWHTEQTLKALHANDLADQSILYVYSDGPKHLALEEDLKLIEEVRQLVNSKQWCKEVHLVESSENIGLVSSFVKSITEVVNKHGKVIVLEDDQITSKGFLKYMNEALVLYKDDEKVMHVSGYMYPSKFKSKETTFFINVQSCPGWGTWKKAWAHYNHDAKDHLKYFGQNKKLRKKFDIEGHAYYFKQLELNAGPVHYSWAVRWYASCLRAEGLSLFPARSLVKNIGLDGTGEHCDPTNMYDVETVDYLAIQKIPLIENKKIRKSVDLFYKKNLKKSIHIKNLIKGFLYTCFFKHIRSVFQGILIKLFPELALLKSSDINWSMVKSTLRNTITGKQVKYSNPFTIISCKVGDYTYIAMNSRIFNTSIGKFCSIGPNFLCGWGVHPVDGVSTHPMFYSTMKQNGLTLSKTNKVQEQKLITIGNDVFIGMNVTVLDGVTIGDGAVVGAGCVVSKDVPPYAIVIGCPMKILRFRFDKKNRKELYDSQWWNFSEDKLRMVEENIFNVEKFVSKLNLVD